MMKAIAGFNDEELTTFIESDKQAFAESCETCQEGRTLFYAMFIAYDAVYKTRENPLKAAGLPVHKVVVRVPLLGSSHICDEFLELLNEFFE